MHILSIRTILVSRILFAELFPPLQKVYTKILELSTCKMKKEHDIFVRTAAKSVTYYH